jgi:tetratricopeptide (TPR) repeat protein
VEKALECNQEELHIRSDLLNEVENEEVADCYDKIGSNNRILGYTDKALDMLQKSLKTKIKLHGENHFNLASTYNNIGNVYR